MEFTEMEKQMLYQQREVSGMPSSRKYLWPHGMLGYTTIKKGARGGQLIIMPVVIADFVSGLWEYWGTDGFGSTGE